MDWYDPMTIYPPLDNDLKSKEVIFESGGKAYHGHFGLAGTEFSFFDDKGYVFNDVSRWRYATKRQEVTA